MQAILARMKSISKGVCKQPSKGLGLHPVFQFTKKVRNEANFLQNAKWTKDTAIISLYVIN